MRIASIEQIEQAINKYTSYTHEEVKKMAAALSGYFQMYEPLSECNILTSINTINNFGDSPIDDPIRDFTIVPLGIFMGYYGPESRDEIINSVTGNSFTIVDYFE